MCVYVCLLVFLLSCVHCLLTNYFNHIFIKSYYADYSAHDSRYDCPIKHWYCIRMQIINKIHFTLINTFVVYRLYEAF